MMMKLRPYQQKAVESIEQQLSVHDSTIAVLCTAAGKTQIACGVIDNLTQRGGDVLFLAHRSELIDQAAERIEQIVKLEPAIEMAERKEAQPGGRLEGSQVVVASVQSMGPRLGKFARDRFQLVVIDECFVAGTKVDGRPIETLRVGDSVSCVDHDTGEIVERQITRTFSSVPSRLLKVTTLRGTEIICTSTHPFYVREIGYVPAERLQNGDVLWRNGIIMDDDLVNEVMVIEPGSGPEYAGQCLGGRVYNIEVEDHHNYFAEGILVHNCHHAPAKSYTKIVDYFDAKVLGITATPTRADKLAMGKIFQSVAFEYDVADGIQDGWIVPVIQQTVETDIDFSKCRTTAGDLNSGDLSAIMEERENLLAIAGPTVDIAKDRPTLVFTVTVAHAHLLADVFREFTQAGVDVVDGKTPKDERRAIFDRFRSGESQFLVNVGIATEGTDLPTAACIANARPTKSVSLYKQIAGRCLRVLPGVVEGLLTPEQRRQAITESDKPNSLLLDFVGNSGRHSLCGAADVLGGSFSEPERKIAEKLLETTDIKDVLGAFRAAKAKIAEMELKRMRERARKQYRTMRIDPFTALGVSKEDDAYGREITEKQAGVLDRAGIPTRGLSLRDASNLIGQIIKRRAAGKASYRQSQALIKRGLDPTKVWSLDFRTASSLMDQLANNGWREPAGWGEGLR